jgi:hypothetical protein
MVTKAVKPKAAKKKKGLTARQEIERERLERQLESNQDRLTRNVTVQGVALSDQQQDTLREIIRVQQEKLDEIMAAL